MTKVNRADRHPAEGSPVARVCVDVPLPHLDRPFDYLVPSTLDDQAQPGVRVKVRFSGQLVDGWLLERVEASGHDGKLAWLEKVVSPEQVLRPEIAQLARTIADRYAGSLADVLRLAVPPRQAAVETAKPPAVGRKRGTKSVEPADSPEPATALAADQAAEGVPVGRDAAVTVAVAPAGDLAAQSASGGAAADGASGGLGAAGASVAGDKVTAEGAGAVAFPEVAGWGRYPAGVAFLRALAQRKPARAVWSALPGERWPERVAEAIAATLHSGRGAVAVVADARDLERLDVALTKLIGSGRHVALQAALGPAERYRRFLRASRGQVQAVIGTRSASFAPVPDLGLVILWDDGDDLHAEPRSPYPHARQVLLTRALEANAAVLLGGYARTAEGQQLLATGWAKEIIAERDVIRVAAPAVRAADESELARDSGGARLPTLAWRATREALAAGAPVLVQVPRRGYVPSVSCQDCRERARCAHCSGPLALTSATAAICRWCARPVAGFQCPACGGRRMRAAVTGVRRTAEELGRALPGVPVWTSGRESGRTAVPVQSSPEGDSPPTHGPSRVGESGVLDTVPGVPALVLATPGAEPVAEGGYGAVLLLDSWALLTRADLRATEETARRWFQAAALAKPAGQGGKVVVVAEGSLAPVQALVRWDPGWLAERELSERRQLGFPPAARMASLTGTAQAVADLLEQARLPERAEVLGPLPVDDETERMLVRVARSEGLRLAGALHEAAGVRSARKAPDAVRIQLDPTEL